MATTNIASQRLNALKIEQSQLKTPLEVISWLGAMQAQDYQGALWGVGLRAPGLTKKQVEEAIIRKEIVRTWPMRGTLHFVAATDIKWMLELMAERVIRGSASRWKRLELNDEIFKKATEVLTTAMQGGKQLTRAEIYTILEAHNISAANQRGNHVIWRLALERTLCFGAHQDKQATYTLLDEWVPSNRSLTKNEALAELTTRYFKSHGPATVQDMMWWSGLPAREINLGLELAHSQLLSETIDKRIYWFDSERSVAQGSTALHLLPAFDEYLLGYRDRSAVLNIEHAQKVVPGNNGMFMPVVVSNGQVKAIWKRNLKTKAISLSYAPFETITSRERSLLKKTAQHYGVFSELPVEVIP